MIQQHLLTDHRSNGKIYDFMTFKKKKPFFLNPIKITLGNPINNSFYMVKNVVFKGKQILALKQENDSNTIVLVEGKVENGQLIHISMLPQEFMADISRMLEGVI